MSFSSGICLVITSCGRIQLLEKTLESFGKFNTYKIDQVVLVEDSGFSIESIWLAALIKVPVDIITIITNEVNLGQFRSIDLAYSQVKTKYIFHLEDDWEFHSPHFIEDSLEIINSDDMISCVWIRGHNDTNNHPVEPPLLPTFSGKTYHYLHENYLGVWSGFTFNPGVRRTKVMQLFMPFSSLELLDESLGLGRQITESDISMHFGRMGYRGAITSKVDGYVTHIGYGHHIPQAFESSLRIFFRNTYYKIRNKWKKHIH